MSCVFDVTSIYRAIGTFVLPVLLMVDAGPRSETGKRVRQTWGKAVEGQAVSISSEKMAYAPGERILLHVRFKNVGRKEVRVLRAHSLALYKVSLLLPDGKAAPWTLFGKRQLDGSGEGSRDVDILKVGEESRVELELTRLFDLSLDGKYTVSVERAVWVDHVVRSALKATSNKLEITIDESLRQRQNGR
jgi:hypothetical protein